MSQEKIRSMLHCSGDNLFSWCLFSASLWALVIFALSDQSSLTANQSRMLTTLIHKSAHVVEFAVLTFVVWGAGRFSEERWAWSRQVARYRAWLVFLLPWLYAILDEVRPYFALPGQTALTDVAIDTAGILLALGLIRLWERQQPCVSHAAPVFIRALDK